MPRPKKWPCPETLLDKAKKGIIDDSQVLEFDAEAWLPADAQKPEQKRQLAGRRRTSRKVQSR